MFAMALSNEALRYVSYPTQVAFPLPSAHIRTQAEVYLLPAQTLPEAADR